MDNGTRVFSDVERGKTDVEGPELFAWVAGEMTSNGVFILTRDLPGDLLLLQVRLKQSNRHRLSKSERFQNK